MFPRSPAPPSCKSQAMTSLQDSLQVPRPVWWAGARTAFDQLCRMLTRDVNAEGDGRVGQPRITILPSGAFSWLGSEEDELDCVAFGTLRDGLFLEAAWQNIASNECSAVEVKVYEASEEGLLLDTSGFLFRVHYIHCPELLRAFPEVIDTPEEFRSTLRTEVEDAVAGLQELELWNNNLKQAPTLRPLYYFLRTWAISCGLYAENDLSCFNANTLQEFIRRTMSGIDLMDYKSTDLFGIICQFLAQHQTCHQSTSIECPFGVEEYISRFSSVKGWTSEKSRLVHEDLRSLLAEFLVADQERSREERCYNILKEHSNHQVPQVMRFGHFICIAMQYSGQSQVEGAKMMDFVQEQVLELKELLGKLPERVEFRVWPARLVQAGATTEDNPYEGFWLIGISLNDSGSEYSAVESALDVWNGQVHADDRYSASIMFVQAALVGRDLVLQKELKKDLRKWPRALAQPDRKLGLNTAPRCSASIPRQLPAAEPKPSRKLRPAMEVLSRLRHDPAFELDDFVVGYADRHSGIEEREARKWVMESTDEEWIPQGRIQYFKRVSDGMVVWDRATKTDTIFKT